MKTTLINPPLISQKNDPHTGIIYMPFMLAYLSSYLKKVGHEVQVIDGFGEAPMQFDTLDKLQVQGMSVPDIVSKIQPDCQMIFIYFSGVVAYRIIEEILKEIKCVYPNVMCVLVENSQAVTAFSVVNDVDNLLKLGFDVLIFGEPEKPAEKLIHSMIETGNIPQEQGLIFKKGNVVYKGEGIPINKELDMLPIPDWESFPLQNYWDVGYAHGPMEGPYLPILTSRGCPVKCRFCVIPATNDGMWRFRSPENVVDEMEEMIKRFGVREFHVEDVNPTVRNQRIVDICNTIIQRKLDVSWKFVSGTKIETMKLETIPLLAQAGCSYVSFSPETGSKALLKKMNKPFHHDLAYKMVKEMSRVGMYSQACFVCGFPGETAEDIQLTKAYIRKLALAGLDEIAQFIITPIPGSSIFSEITGYDSFSQLTFSPTWRKDYKQLVRRRWGHYAYFLFWKCIRFPHKVLRQVVNICRGKFSTKMEQAIYRVTFWKLFKRKVQYVKS
ncbi:MAG: B12-binding domain-containing radical SAM protein [Candidatus Margulisbacteria bacterium]|nr:B12-binding domain-containing radical SAM protein [Candidatus Margulisiibacteriota bacterium]